jgi:hypothetical protein
MFVWEFIKAIAADNKNADAVYTLGSAWKSG